MSWAGYSTDAAPNMGSYHLPLDLLPRVLPIYLHKTSVEVYMRCISMGKLQKEQFNFAMALVVLADVAFSTYFFSVYIFIYSFGHSFTN